MLVKKYIVFGEPVPLDASFAHQSSCNIFFFQRFFFLVKVWKNMFWPGPPTTPGYNYHNIYIHYVLQIWTGAYVIIRFLFAFLIGKNGKEAGR